MYILIVNYGSYEGPNVYEFDSTVEAYQVISRNDPSDCELYKIAHTVDVPQMMRDEKQRIDDLRINALNKLTHEERLALNI